MASNGLRNEYMQKYVTNAAAIEKATSAGTGARASHPDKPGRAGGALSVGDSTDTAHSETIRGVYRRGNERGVKNRGG